MKKIIIIVLIIAVLGLGATYVVLNYNKKQDNTNNYDITRNTYPYFKFYFYPNSKA